MLSSFAWSSYSITALRSGKDLKPFHLKRGEVTPAPWCWPAADGLSNGGALGWEAGTRSSTLDSVTEKKIASLVQKGLRNMSLRGSLGHLFGACFSKLCLKR